MLGFDARGKQVTLDPTDTDAHTPRMHWTTVSQPTSHQASPYSHINMSLSLHEEPARGSVSGQTGLHGPPSGLTPQASGPPESVGSPVSITGPASDPLEPVTLPPQATESPRSEMAMCVRMLGMVAALQPL